jgi:DNA-binding MurR/RpiR family transcriptional regulator
MANDKLLDRIRALQKLTPGEAKIADFLSRRFPETVFDNVTTISQKSGVSKATVVRFISRLGYSSFYEFRNQQRHEVVSRLESPVQRYSLKKRQLMGEGEDILGQNFAYIMKNLRHTHARTDPKTFREVARLIDVTPKDTLFVISHRRYATLTHKVAETFAGAGARIILLTDSEFSPLSSLAHLQLVVPSEGLSIFQSYCAASALLESLVIAALQFCDERVFDRSEKAEKLYEHFDTFSAGKGTTPSRADKLREKIGRQNRKTGKREKTGT